MEEIEARFRASIEALPREEQMRLAKNDRRVLDFLFANTSVLSYDHNQLRYWRDHG